MLRHRSTGNASARVGRIALVVVGLPVAAVLAVLLFGRPAGAGPALSAASPAYEAAVGAPPAAVTLTFTTALAQAHVEVSGAVASLPVIDQRTVTVPVANATAGRHVVAYHVVTAGGAELSGTLPFTVGEPAGGSVAAAAPGPAVAPAAGPDAEPQVPVRPAAHQHGEVDPLTLAVLAVNVVVVLVLATLFLRRPRRSAAEPEQAAGSEPAAGQPADGRAGQRAAHAGQPAAHAGQPAAHAGQPAAHAGPHLER